MVKSVIFDLGRVLLTFEPEEYLIRLYGNGEKARILYKAVFGSKTWIDLDRGTVGYDEAIDIMSKKYSRYTEDIAYIMHNWVEIMKPVEENIKLLKDLKLKDFSLFLLSNFHKEAYDKVFGKYAFFQLFDGIFISSHHKLLKPAREIYVKMLQMFSLNPAECIFIDDTRENVSAAEELGITGILYTGPEELQKELRNLRIL